MIKTVFKRLGIGVLSLAVVAGGFAAHEWHADKPVMLRAFLDRTLIKMALDSPETLTSLGVLESLGINGHNAELDDDSPEKGERMLKELLEAREVLLSYDDASLSDDERLSKDVALYLLNFMEQSKQFRYHNYPVNQLFGIQNGYPSFMQAKHPVTSVEDAEHYLSRLKKVERKFQQNLRGLKLREQLGIIPPRFVIDRVLEEMTAFVATPVTENILYTSLDERLSALDSLDPKEKQRLLAVADASIRDYVHPAYQLFIDYFVALKPKAGSDHGFWHLPNGDKAYQASLQLFTSTDYSADEIHQLGLAEVDRIQAQMLTILAGQGIDTDAGFTAAIATLAADSRFYFEDSEAGRQQILAEYRRILDEINAGLGGAFTIRPQAGMEVVRIPEFKEKTSPGAYYEPPSLDGARPGRFFANLYDIRATPKYSMRTLAYHEGIPGHHFQIAVAMELEGLPFFRRMSPFTAYVEGWALYAEQVAWELGFQQDPLDNLGRLQAELFRAVRLVVDTGIHAKRWSRERGIDYMQANTGMATSDVVAEIERYIVMPGQATSYKVGMMKILALREKAKDALGEQFELAAFHDAVLKNGALPLSILEQVVDDYITTTQGLAKAG
ncbi:Uncharacterized conserved protein, DUF885 familyt [Ferrimonas sediminum]|uniref:Uncharacterized conserved protein, DUF885 familyt n=1 Tax=Ferrimonas sediminum TaxID=718193 RepID=A0A1G9B368_9GAMM|nr:DUF885 domain-containing protein [Ferrimonas sediminum]SDK33918.1 Uncharacterized conserved protein, DUF885 familyt [Ferrimonas sediminum]